MKKIFFISVKTVFVLILFTAFLLACKKGEKASSESLDKDTSYAFGMLIASQMGLHDFSFDYNSLMEGFRDFNEAKQTRLTPDQAMDKINNAVSRIQMQENEQMWLEGEKNREEGEAYLSENGRRSEVSITASGLQYEVLSEGTGNKPDPWDTVRVHYEGTLIDGTIFDSSYSRGSPVEFPLNGVIPGWSEGVQLMNEGSTYRLVIPSNLAYGPGGTGPIPPNSTLIFKIELLSILK